jgi:ribosomal protein S18 acetylase RimI-like enzyme
MKLKTCTRDEFVSAITADKADSFAKTFVAKADMQKIWDSCIGAYDGDELMGAIITTVSIRSPKVANLQLLHTFAKHRRKGVAKTLTNASFSEAVVLGSIYFRVSAEPDAVAFYESIGFKFWGLQKSGCSLSIFKINGTEINDGLYDDSDPIVNRALYSGKKGSLVSSYETTNTLSEFLL